MYSIKQSKKGDLLLIIEPQSCAPDYPLFIYDGGDTALLFRDWMLGDNVYRDYIAPIRIVRDVKRLIA